MKLKCLFLLLLLGISFCVHAQKRPVILEKQLEIIRKAVSYTHLDVYKRQHYDNVKQMVKEKTGRAMQEKERKRKGKNGKIIKVAGCSPIREGVLLIRPDTTLADVRKFGEECQMCIRDSIWSVSGTFFCSVASQACDIQMFVT